MSVVIRRIIICTLGHYLQRRCYCGPAVGTRTTLARTKRCCPSIVAPDSRRVPSVPAWLPWTSTRRRLVQRASVAGTAGPAYDGSAGVYPHGARMSSSIPRHQPSGERPGPSENCTPSTKHRGIHHVPRPTFLKQSMYNMYNNMGEGGQLYCYATCCDMLLLCQTVINRSIYCNYISGLVCLYSHVMHYTYQLRNPSRNLGRPEVHPARR